MNRRLSLSFASVASIAVLGLGGCSPDGVPGAGDVSGTDDDALKVCASGTTVEGIDVSEFQGNINWSAVKASGRKFAVIRVSDGLGHFDPKFNQNWSEAKSAGMIRSVYQFFRASEDGTAQANLLLEHMGTLEAGDLPPVADVEVTDGVGAGALNSQLAKWTARIKQATGKTPMIYTSPGLWSSLSGSTSFGGDTLWVANWGVSCPSTPVGWSHWKFWQYADNGHVSGIGDLVDLDKFNGSLDDLEKFADENLGPPTMPIPAEPKSCGAIDAGQGLGPGKSLKSCDGRFELVMQTDGNVVLYEGQKALWATGTNGKGGYAFVMQGDGNLVLYDAYQAPLWASNTDGKSGDALAIQNDGNLVLYRAGKAIWDSGTWGH